MTMASFDAHICARRAGTIAQCRWRMYASYGHTQGGRGFDIQALHVHLMFTMSICMLGYTAHECMHNTSIYTFWWPRPPADYENYRKLLF